jgi:hypothetical protein
MPTLSVAAVSAAPVSSQLTYVSTPVSRADVVSNCHIAATTISQGGAASASTTINTQLQADIGQLSLEDSTEPSASTGKPKSRRAPAAATHKHQTAAQKA